MNIGSATASPPKNEAQVNLTKKMENQQEAVVGKILESADAGTPDTSAATGKKLIAVA